MSDVTIAKEEKFFIVDLNGWKMADFRAFIAATKDEAWDVIFPLLSMVVLEWPFDHKIDDMENLGLADLAATIRAVQKAVANAFSEGN
jgi:hypothetical protein